METTGIIGVFIRISITHSHTDFQWPFVLPSKQMLYVVSALEAFDDKGVSEHAKAKSSHSFYCTGLAAPAPRAISRKFLQSLQLLFGASNQRGLHHIPA